MYVQLLLLGLILSAVGVNWRNPDTSSHNETQLINGGRYEIGHFRVPANFVKMSSICISVVSHLASLWNSISEMVYWKLPDNRTRGPFLESPDY